MVQRFYTFFVGRYYGSGDGIFRIVRQAGGGKDMMVDIFEIIRYL